LTILLTSPVFFSKTKISSGPRNAILEGNSIPSAYFSIARLESTSTIVGSLLGEEPNCDHPGRGDAARITIDRKRLGRVNFLFLMSINEADNSN
jgi:hypothetical protein